jgi:TonB family protein
MVKRIFVLFLFLFACEIGNTQCILKHFKGYTYCIETKDSCLDTNQLLSIPRFPGNLNQWIADSIDYPEQALDAHIRGTVCLTFTVEKEGYITNVKIVSGVNRYLDYEASLAVISMPQWKPGIKQRHKIATSMYIAIHFEIKGWDEPMRVKTTTHITIDSDEPWHVRPKSDSIK